MASSLEPPGAGCGAPAARDFSCSRRSFAALPIVVSPLVLSKSFAQAEEAVTTESNETNKSGGVLDGILSFFDPNEVTKSGKKLPKKYLKAARNLVKDLREALEKDPVSDDRKFKEAANTAKDSIREYLIDWKGSKEVETQDSYRELEKALRQLSTFYMKSGPTAVMPEDIRKQILEKLTNAEADL